MTVTNDLNALQGNVKNSTPVGGGVPTRLWVADVRTVNSDGTVDVRPVNSRNSKVHVPVIATYSPVVGDRVLVSELNGEQQYPVVIGLLVAQAVSIPGDSQPGDFIFSGASSRVGALICHGQGYSPTTYPDLYDAIGFSYGGTSTAPLLPNMQGRLPLGAGSSGTQGATTWSVGNQPSSGPGGEEKHLLLSTESGQPAGTTQQDSPDHTHTPSGGSNFATTIFTAQVPGAGSAFAAINGDAATTAGASVRHYHSITAANAASTHNILPPVSVGNWFIKT